MLKFGTDGVRGVANLDLTPEVVLALGRAAARVLPAHHFAVGRDTRRSGPLLEAALIAGLTAEGATVVTLGVAPTPAIAWVAATGAIAGAVISASHNPFEDNGVKLFGPGGKKLDDFTEAALERELHGLLRHEVSGEPHTGTAVGTVVEGVAEVDGWRESVGSSLDGRRLDGVRVVLDCANGAASAHGPALLSGLGAEVLVLHAPARPPAGRGQAPGRCGHRARRRRRPSAGRRRDRAHDRRGSDHCRRRDRPTAGGHARR